MTVPPPLSELLPRLRALVDAAESEGTGRVLLGITGAPGSGKTTLAQALVAALNAPLGAAVNVPPAAGGSQAALGIAGTVAAHVPMDGFHLADVALRRLGRSERKGAPDTFDARGYLALLVRLRTEAGTVWAPAFDRDLEQPIAGSIPIEASVQVVISEGNYLLLDDPEWRAVAEQFDEVWFCAPDEQARINRLVARHVEFGKPPDQAREWALGTDQRNAERVEATRSRADLVINGDADLT